jgi:hypothetical protein
MYVQKVLLYTFFIFSLLSCQDKEADNVLRTSIDSLSGALNQKVFELQKTDTALLNKATVKFTNYKRFIEQYVSDTLSKTEADAIVEFQNAGNILNSFLVNKEIILRHGQLLSAQLNNLSTDLKNNSAPQLANNYFSNEKKEADNLIKAILSQQQNFQTNIQKFKNSLPLIEEIIKRNNGGQLPFVVKDTLAI